MVNSGYQNSLNKNTMLLISVLLFFYVIIIVVIITIIVFIKQLEKVLKPYAQALFDFGEVVKQEASQIGAIIMINM